MNLATFNRKEVLAFLDRLKPEDKVELVGDQGVYLMSFAEPPKGRKVVYAYGCNPLLDAGWYENKHAIYGGDDGGDTIGTAREVREILHSSGDEDLNVILTETDLRVTTKARKA